MNFPLVCRAHVLKNYRGEVVAHGIKGRRQNAEVGVYPAYSDRLDSHHPQG